MQAADRSIRKHVGTFYQTHWQTLFELS